MLEKNKTYPIDLGKDYQTNETTFKNILNDIKEMYPWYRQTKVIDNISIKEITNDGGIKLLKYQYIKNITHSIFFALHSNTFVFLEGELLEVF